MKIEHLQEHVNDYKASIEIVVEKKTIWNTKTRSLLFKTLNSIVNRYKIGWQAQELNWINSNEAVNITFDSFPQDLIEKTCLVPSHQFVKGGSLIFSQMYSGDVNIFILFPFIVKAPMESDSIDLGTYDPKDISEKLIIEKVDEFLKEMIKWEVPSIKSKLGF